MDGDGISVGFGYASYTHEWGSGNHAADTRFFVLEYDDWRHVLKTDNRPAGDSPRRHGEHPHRYVRRSQLHAFTTNAGNIDLLGWGAVQTGRWGTQQQRAYAVDFEGGLQPAILPELKPWLRGGFTIGSGDGNPNDNGTGLSFRSSRLRGPTRASRFST